MIYLQSAIDIEEKSVKSEFYTDSRWLVEEITSDISNVVDDLHTYCSMLDKGEDVNLQELGCAMKRFTDILNGEYPRKIIISTLEHPKIEKKMPIILDVYHDSLKWMEVLEAKDVNCLEDLDKLEYTQLYKKLVKAEAGSYGLNDGDRIAMIGAGSLPQTILNIYSLAADKEIGLFGVEWDKASYDAAVNLTGRLGIENVKLIHDDGVEHDYSNYSVVVMADQLVKKNEILQKLDHNFNGRGIIMRTCSDNYNDLRQLIHAKQEKIKIPYGFSVSKIEKDPIVFPDSFYLTRKNSSIHHL